MPEFSNKKLFLKDYLFKQWSILAACALIAAITILSSTIALDYFQDIRLKKNLLERHFPTLYEQVFREAILAEQGKIDARIQTLKEAYDLPLFVLIEPDLLSKEMNRFSRFIWMKQPLLDQRILVAGIHYPKLPFHLSHIFSTLIPMVLFVIFGFWYQKRFFGRTILNPLHRLLKEIEDETIPESWAHEFIELKKQILLLLKQKRQDLREEAEKHKEKVLNRYSLFIFREFSKVVERFKEWLKITTVPEKLAFEMNQLIHKSELLREKSLIEFQKDQIASLPSSIPTSYCLVPSLDKIIKSYKEAARKNGIKFHSAASPQLAFQFSTLPPEDLENVLKDLLNNALDAAAQSQKKEVSLTLRSDGMSCSLLIKDSGPGFTPKAWDSVITGEEFSTKKNGKGTGIQNAKRILSHHDGRLTYLLLSGTTHANIQFPLVSPPPWFLNVLKIESKDVGLLTEDPRVFAYLTCLFRSEKSIHFFENETEFLDFAKRSTHSTLLIDEDAIENGSTWMKKHHLFGRASILSSKLPSEVVSAEIPDGILLCPKICLEPL